MAVAVRSNQLAGKMIEMGRTAKVVLRGTHRSTSLEQTLARVQRLAPVMGITRVANVTGLDPVGIPVVMVSRPNSRSISVSQGKGLDLLSARISGLMEAAELYHAETSTLPVRATTYEELRYQNNVVDPQELPRCAGSRFNPNLRLLWCEARDLTTGETWFVPYELVHTNYTIPLPDGHGCFIASSSGLASGNQLVEAISHAICEIVERDATTLWRMWDAKKQNAAQLDLLSVDDHDCLSLIEKLDRAGLTTAVWDVTSDIALPVFACMIASRSDDSMWHGSAATGYGCHPDRRIALARAITEAAQSRLTIIAGLRDDFGSETFDAGLDQAVIEEIRTSSLNSRNGKHFFDVTTWERDTIEDDLETEMQCLERAGFCKILVVDLSKPGLGLPVVRVIIPGLEPMLVPDYLPGRRAREILATGL